MLKPWKTAIFGLGLLLAGPLSASAEIKLGMWETTVHSEVEGMPFSPPPVTMTDCVTKKDLVPSTESPDQQCDVMEQQIKGNTVSWRVRCQHDGMSTSGDGEIRYSGDTFQGEMRMTMSGGPMGEMKMKQTMKGRWLGTCP